jgi:hypothetical protein
MKKFLGAQVSASWTGQGRVVGRAVWTTIGAPTRKSLAHCLPMDVENNFG